MPRSARMLIDGGTYHVLTRGNNGQTVFHQDADYQRYLQLLSECAKAHQLKLYHFALMPNHVHLVLEAAQGGGLSHAMHGLNLTYALFYQRHYQYRGHLWQDRFKSLLIDRDSYLLECGRYVELNPVRGGLTKDPRDYAWSSYRVYAEGVDNPLIAPNPLYETLGATVQKRQHEYREFIQRGIAQEPSLHLDRYQFIGGTTASMKVLEELFGVPRIRRRRGRPRKMTTPGIDGGKNRTVPNFFNREGDEK